MHDLHGRKARLFATALILVALALPTAVWAHATLVSATPAIGTTVETTPPVVSATFDDDLEVAKSSIEVVGPGDVTIARGGVSADDPKTLAVEVPLLAAGTYAVRWVAASEDGHLERGQYEFAVAAGASAGPTTTATASGSTPTASPPSGAASPASAYAPPSSAPPSASPEPGGGGSGGSESAGQILVIAVVGLGLGLAVGWWRSRRSG